MDDDAPTWSERVARTATRGMGSIAFIAVQTVVIVAWVALNAWLLGRHAFDPMPFILLNLLFSTQAAYSAPLILLAQNKQEDRDQAAAALERREVAEVDGLTIEQMMILREMHHLLRLQNAQMGLPESSEESDRAG